MRRKGKASGAVDAAPEAGSTVRLFRLLGILGGIDHAPAAINVLDAHIRKVVLREGKNLIAASHADIESNAVARVHQVVDIILQTFACACRELVLCCHAGFLLSLPFLII